MGDDSSGLITVASPIHHDLLVCGLWKFLTIQHGVDFSIQLNGRDIAAHQLILEVFLSPEKLAQTAEVVAVTGTEHGELNQQAIDESCRRRDTNFDYLVEFLYNGRVTMQEGHLEQLLEVARELDFAILVEALQEATSSAGTTTKDVDDDGACSIGNDVEATGTMTRQASSRRQRKGNPAKLVKNEAESEDGWADLPKKRLRSTKMKRKSEPQVASSVCFEEESCLDEDDSSSECFEGGDTKDPADVLLNIAGESGGASETVGGNAGATRPIKRGRGKIHRTTSGGRQHHKCKFCGYETSINVTFQIHMTKHDPSIPVFKCGDCSRKFLSELTLSKHRLKHASGPESYECPHCDYKVRTKTRYRIHLAKHDPSVAVFRCGTCGRQVFNEEALQRHMLKHKIYKCTHCEFETPKRWSYDHHLFSKHQVNCRGETVSKLLCSQCSFTCKTESELKYHTVAKHSGDRPHKCPHAQCNFSSGRKGDVGKHIKSIHLNLRPCLCETCGYRTVSQSALEQHKRSHTGQKVFKCDFEKCEKSYGDHSTLRRHKQVAHGNDGKPFVCHVCANSYNRRDHLRIHLGKAHEIVPGSGGV